uniref:Uncharacterized protein n=1 Tax=Arundo donax TaxID=35708 RepID=A0A0A9E567_ARUDO
MQNQPASVPPSLCHSHKGRPAAYLDQAYIHFQPSD